MEPPSDHGRRLFVPLILAAKPLIIPAIILIIILLVCCCCYTRRAGRAARRSWRRRFGSSDDAPRCGMARVTSVREIDAFVRACSAAATRWSRATGWLRSTPIAAPFRGPPARGQDNLSSTGQLARDRLMARVGRGPGMQGMQELIPPPAPAPSAASSGGGPTSSWRAWASGAWSRVEESPAPAQGSAVWPPPAHGSNAV